MADIENPGAHGRCATGAGKPSHATAAGTRTIAHSKGRAKRAGLYHVQPEGGEPFQIYAKGRDAWALDRLREAGPKGCTPIDQPAPRWSAYVFNLRGLGVPIETVTKPHGGEFLGHHGRYVLRAKVGKGGCPMLTVLVLLGVPIWQALPYATGFYLALFAMLGGCDD